MTQETTIDSGSKKAAQSPGRPRGFDEAKALEAALQVFWKQGYEATSLDDLTSAMGISRSSFYGAFGSKQSVLTAALKTYSDANLARLREIAIKGGTDPVGAMLVALTGLEAGQKGCLLVNCITELAPHQEEVAALGRRHLEQIERILAEAVNPHDPEAALDKARALSALTIGTLAMRKSGFPPEKIVNSLKEARAIIAPS
ncbi:TetR/AcrR family transcriptional regulator [Roseibium hamelinense]|nr:TetR/AcrR family transcriptional regulator [Roseibium hamelinense]MTI42797.1 TetR/AcrR family transcriptional regulator [Roseibium hamelinense]